MAENRRLHVGNLHIANDLPLTLIAGPCALESRAHAQEMCQALVELTGRLGIGLIYKTSFDKANRTLGSLPSMHCRFSRSFGRRIAAPS